MKEMMFYIGVKALIEDKKGRILLFHSPGWSQQNIQPHWDLPGGRIDVGENLLTALKREIYEETGIKKYSKPQFFYATISHHLTTHKIYDFKVGLAILVYKIKIPGSSEFKISDEHTKYEWVTPKEAGKRLSEKYPNDFTQLLI